MKIHASEGGTLKTVAVLFLPWDQGDLRIVSEDIHGEGNPYFVRQVLLTIPCSSPMDDMEFSTGCGRAPFQGGKSLTFFTTFVDHNYYLDVVLNLVLEGKRCLSHNNSTTSSGQTSTNSLAILGTTLGHVRVFEKQHVAYIYTHSTGQIRSKKAKLSPGASVRLRGGALARPPFQAALANPTRSLP